MVGIFKEDRMMANLSEIVEYCDTRVRRREITDFPPANNGLQIASNGDIRKIGAAVDGGCVPFQRAVAAGVDFLIVHHGIFWNPPIPIVGPAYEKLRVAFDNDLAVYGAHLPLDCHPEIGNNALLAKELGLEVSSWFLPYEGNLMGAVVEQCPPRAVLRERMQAHFPQTCIAIEYGPEQPLRIGILTGSGQSAIAHLAASGIDTFITGELKQEHFNIAQENGFNLYLGGHYATEVFGVQALAAEVAETFGLPWEFIETECPL